MSECGIHISIAITGHLNSNVANGLRWMGHAVSTKVNLGVFLDLVSHQVSQSVVLAIETKGGRCHIALERKLLGWRLHYLLSHFYV